MLHIIRRSVPCRLTIWFVSSLFCLVLAACGGGHSTDVVVGVGAGSGDAAGIRLIAGSIGSAGEIDGTGAAARFNNPHGIAADAAGNLYVADTGNQAIRKITTAGATSTLAGMAGAHDSIDGIGPAARFGAPYGIAADAAGNLYVTDAAFHTIRRVSPTGAVTTLAGTAGVAGSADGAGLAAQFNSPFGITIDAAGNLYVADTGNHAIRRVTPTGAVTTVAGMPGESGSADGVRMAARFQSPFGIAADAAGNLFVADTGNHTVREITFAGAVRTLAGTAQSSGSADGRGVDARFHSPQGIALDSAGNVYVADTMNHTIRRITPAGATSTVAGIAGRQGIVLGSLPGGLSLPAGIASLGDKTFAVTSGNSVLRLRAPESFVSFTTQNIPVDTRTTQATQDANLPSSCLSNFCLR